MTAKLALVTGASGGIGAAAARSLAAEGHRVAVTYLQRRAEAEALAEEIGGRAYPLDLRRSEDIPRLTAQVEDELGTVQILVHNAGLIKDGLLAFLSEGDWDEVHEVNLRGPFRLTKALLKGMLGCRWGRVISIASLSGVSGQLGQTHYSSAKAGLIAFTKSVARECAAYSVTANAIAPGFIDTELIQSMPEKKLRAYVDEIPLRRLGTADEVASLVSYLASEPAAYITGQVFRVDGGLMMA